MGIGSGGVAGGSVAVRVGIGEGAAGGWVAKAVALAAVVAIGVGGTSVGVLLASNSIAPALRCAQAVTPGSAIA